MGVSRGGSSFDQSVVLGADEFQYLQTAVWTLDQLNFDPDIMPNVTIGFTVVDDGSNDQVGVLIVGWSVKWSVHCVVQ